MVRLGLAGLGGLTGLVLHGVSLTRMGIVKMRYRRNCSLHLLIRLGCLLRWSWELGVWLGGHRVAFNLNVLMAVMLNWILLNIVWRHILHTGWFWKNVTKMAKTA